MTHEEYYKRKSPDEKEIYWYVEFYDNSVRHAVWYGFLFDRERLIANNCFPSSNVARRYLKYCSSAIHFTNMQAWLDARNEFYSEDDYIESNEHGENFRNWLKETFEGEEE